MVLVRKRQEGHSQRRGGDGSRGQNDTTDGKSHKPRDVGNQNLKKARKWISP